MMATSKVKKSLDPSPKPQYTFNSVAAAPSSTSTSTSTAATTNQTVTAALATIDGGQEELERIINQAVSKFNENGKAISEAFKKLDASFDELETRIASEKKTETASVSQPST